ncbi:MAG TPA: CVNH domain-containing protein [Stellaceae bacterium]|nr:CVNH domain-containing protein [Stellaceae bacterium]
MRTASLAASALLGALLWSSAAPAQQPSGPHGSYLSSCTNIQLLGDVLSATCTTADGREQRSSLAGVKNCVGDIGNANGALQCSFADGTQALGQALPEADNGPGAAGAGTAQGTQRCEALHRNAEDLRARLTSTWSAVADPELERRYREARGRAELCQP